MEPWTVVCMRGRASACFCLRTKHSADASWGVAIARPAHESPLLLLLMRRRHAERRNPLLDGPRAHHFRSSVGRQYSTALYVPSFSTGPPVGPWLFATASKLLHVHDEVRDRAVTCMFRARYRRTVRLCHHAAAGGGGLQCSYRVVPDTGRGVCSTAHRLSPVWPSATSSHVAAARPS